MEADNILAARRAPGRSLALEDQTLREALQMHPWPLPVRARRLLVEELRRAGLRRLQVGALVRRDRLPQMAHSDELISKINQLPGLEVWALVLNEKGLRRARQCGLQNVALSASLAPIHSQRNLGCAVAEGLERCLALAELALAWGLGVRMGLQCAFGGPMFKPPQPEELLALLRPFSHLGVPRLALADTAARAKAVGIAETLACLRAGLPGAELGLHLHGEPEQLTANLEAAWAGGADWLDVTLAGRGGCPFLPGRPPANLSTRQAVEFLNQKGLDSGVDLMRLDRTAAVLGTLLADIGVGA